jgi:hypothetical protein
VGNELAEAERLLGEVHEQLGESEQRGMKLVLDLAEAISRSDGYQEELRKQREVLLYINRISAENEALRRQSIHKTDGQR